MNQKLEYAASIGLGLYETSFQQPNMFLLAVSAIAPAKVGRALQIYVVLSTLDRYFALSRNPPVIDELKG